jgi:hypothetical protein
MDNNHIRQIDFCVDDWLFLRRQRLQKPKEEKQGQSCRETSTENHGFLRTFPKTTGYHGVAIRGHAVVADSL